MKSKKKPIIILQKRERLPESIIPLFLYLVLKICVGSLLDNK